MIALLLLLLLLCCCTLLAATDSSLSSEDLYALLGVAKTATLKEIKSAYRRKALETHPDKAGAGAEEDFIRVAHAFEVLTDEASRKSYDATGKTTSSTDGGGTSFTRADGSFDAAGFSNAFDAFFVREHGFSLSEARKSQAMTLQVVSLQQLRAMVLDDDDNDGGTLESHLLMIFVTPQAIETVADNKLFFPHPFGFYADGSNVQAVKVRYHRENELTRFFDIPHGDELNEGGNPVILFGRKGSALSSNFERLETSDRLTFEAWVWQQLQFNVAIVNQHSHPIDVYWVRNQRARKLVASGIQPGEHRTHVEVSLSQELWIRDARIDNFPGAPPKSLTRESVLMVHTVVGDDDQEMMMMIVVEHVDCLDLSSRCSSWASRNECNVNPDFMSAYCQRSCNRCDTNIIDDGNARPEL